VRGEWQIGETGRRRRRYRLTQAEEEGGAAAREWSELFQALRQLAKVACLIGTRWFENGSRTLPPGAPGENDVIAELADH